MADIRVPDVVGSPQLAAETQLKNAGLLVGTVTTASSATAQAGSVISTNPAAGTVVGSGSPVNLEVSTGPAQVAVPNVVGSTQPAADTLLKNAGLVVGTVTTASSATTPTGSVSSANPPSGTMVAPGSPVNLEVSTGPAQVAVPNVVGSTQPAADTLLKKAGLLVGTVTTASSATTAAGSVSGANPPSGTMVAPGSPVNLEVSSGPGQVAVPNVVGLTQLAAEAALRTAGLMVGTLSNERSSTVPAGGVASTSPAVGSLVSQGTAVNLEVSTGPKGDWTQWALPGGFGVLGVGLLGIILWGITDRTEGGFLSKLADEETARGLITFLIAITTVGIAVILAISTVVLKESPENEKRFDRGKQVLTILIGVLGTIVGFYFGSAGDTENPPPPEQAQTLTITTDALPAGAANTAYPSTTLEATGGTRPLNWSVIPALPDGLTLDATGAISGTPKSASQMTYTFTVKDSSTPAVSSGKELTLEIK